MGTFGGGLAGPWRSSAHGPVASGVPRYHDRAEQGCRVEGRLRGSARFWGRRVIFHMRVVGLQVLTAYRQKPTLAPWI